MLPYDDLIAFSLAHPGPPRWPVDMLRRFLTQLVSTPELVLDLRENGERSAVAVLVDRVRNPGNNASLEILGMKSEASLPEILKWARARVPQRFAGFEVALPPALAAAQGLAPYYETYGMVLERPGSVEPPPPGLCTIVTDRDEAELYQMMLTCFAENPDTNISDFEEWQAARRAPSRSKTWGVWRDKQLVAFLNLVVPREIAFAEIRMVGVLPEHRGRGYAQALIRRALGYVAQLEIPRCALTVAVRNERALDLYRKLGFREVERQSVFRWGR